MSKNLQNDKIILGLKVRQLRTDKELSLAELHRKSGVSISYLNEIEKGKKYPRKDMLKKLSNALEVSSDQLISKDLPANLDPIFQLLNSNFLQDLPLDFFKIELVKIIEIIANAPVQVGAFITTLIELARNYAMQQESFYFAALRSYLELHNNYFEQLEAQVKQFIQQYYLPERGLIPTHKLATILEEEFGYEIVKDGLDQYPDLRTFRSVFLPKSKKILLNSQLTDRQLAFQFGKELGFNVLGVKERASTSSLLKPKSFNEVLNHSKAIYFSVALLMNEQEFIQDITQFFRQKKWDGDAFLNIMNKYGASPEMFYHRLTNILPKVFDLDKLFFIRFTYQTPDDFKIDRVFHLNDGRHLQQNELSEHHSRRWVAISCLKDAVRRATPNPMEVYVQRGKYRETNDEYLCFTITRSHYPTPDKNVSVILGLMVDKKLKRQIHFLEDSSIPMQLVDTAPDILAARKERKRVQQVLDELMEE
ncbi:MAG: helix-turn-helix domain-containing protein [Bacteroidota bacterium]